VKPGRWESWVVALFSVLVELAGEDGNDGVARKGLGGG
jgi:hypothetical protein